jgi:hypothetical protein
VCYDTLTQVLYAIDDYNISPNFPITYKRIAFHWPKFSFDQTNSHAST